MSNRLVASLPKHSRAILRRLESLDRQRAGRHQARRAEVADLSARMRALSHDRSELEAARDRGTLPESELQRLAATEAESAEIEQRMIEIGRETEPAQMSAERARWLLGQLPAGAKIKSHEVKIEFRSRKDLTAARKALAEVQAERDAIAKAPRTIDEAREAVRSELAAIAGRGLPLVSDCFVGGGVGWPMASIPRAPGNGEIPRVHDGFAVLCWLFGSEIEKRLDVLLESNKPEFSMTAAEQAEALTKLDAKLDTAWRNLCALIEHAEETYPADAPIGAVLQIDITT